MKILIVGDKAVWAIENHYLEHLKSKDITCEIFAAGYIFRKNYHSIFQKVRHKFWPTLLYKKINRQLLQYFKTFQPDVVWVFKGMEILPATLKKLKEQNIFLVNYNPDHPFILSSKGSGNANVINSIHLYQLHYSYHPDVVKQINENYSIPCKMLPFAFHHQGFDFGFMPKEEIVETAFVGNPDDIRKKIILYLANNGIKVNVYGHSWRKHLPENKNIKVHDAVYQQELWLTLQKYRLQLNIFRDHNIGAHNMRTFEIPSVGGIMLAPKNEQHCSFFEPDKEAFFFKTNEELLKKVGQILSLTAQEAAKIRMAAFDKAKEFTYLKRTEEFLATLNEYIK